MPRPERLSVRYMLHRIREDVFGSERGLLLTIWHLLVAPQQVAQAFIRGDDLRYYGPVKFFIVAIAASILLMPAMPFLDGVIAQFISSKQLMTREAALAFVADWNSLLNAPLLFMLAGITRYFFRDRGYNYAEHLVVAAYG